MADIFNMADTWNAGGTTFNAILMNVTDTASAAASALLKLQVAGTTKAEIRKDGSLRLTGASSGAAIIYSDTQFRPGSIQIGYNGAGGNAFAVSDATAATIYGSWGTNGLISGGTRYIGFATTPDSTPDARFHRTAAGIVRYSSDGTVGAVLEFGEQTAPSAPSTNFVRLYAQDNGAGKTQLMALFATGAAQQIAIEP